MRSRRLRRQAEIKKVWNLIRRTLTLPPRFSNLRHGKESLRCGDFAAARPLRMMNLTTLRRVRVPLLAVAIFILAASGRAEEQTWQPPASNLWTNGPGTGFLSGVQTLTFEAGGVYGLRIFGSSQAHDLALTSFSYGRMMGPVMGEDHWYRGNWELRAEMFGGAQISPSDSYDTIFGLTPHLRYDFATGSRWIPFMDAGAGVTVTGIGAPDLAKVFDFNLQVGPGVHWFVRDNWAVTVDTKFFHVSDAGINHPNHGLNGVLGMVGLTWFF